MIVKQSKFLVAVMPVSTSGGRYHGRYVLPGELWWAAAVPGDLRSSFRPLTDDDEVLVVKGCAERVVDGHRVSLAPGALITRDHACAPRRPIEEAGFEPAEKC